MVFWIALKINLQQKKNAYNYLNSLYFFVPPRRRALGFFGFIAILRITNFFPS